jgi:amidase
MDTVQLAESIKSKKYTSRQVVTAYLQKIALENPKYNAIVTIEADTALKRAREIDEDVSQGKASGLLQGVPFTIKDTFQTKGIRTTAGDITLSDFIPEKNAVVVERLLAAGAILMGKTNCSTLAMDMQSNNKVFGRTNNAYDVTKTAGGSSGGSAVAVALHMTPFEIGSDLAGSIRLPAAFNGIVGFRPTFGLTSLRGHIPPKPDEINGVRRMAVVGPLARSVNDLHFLLNIISGPSSGDRSLVPLNDFKDKVGLKNIKIAWADEIGEVKVQREIKNSLKDFVDKLKNHVSKIEKNSPKDFPYIKAWETWGELVGAQGGYDVSQMARWFGDIFTRSEVADTPLQRKIVGPISIPKYMTSLKSQDEMIDRMEQFLTAYDVWILPVSSTTAFSHLEPTKMYGDFPVYKTKIKVDEFELPYFNATQQYATIFSITESPVVVIPIGYDLSGMPIGIQIVGRRYSDLKLLRIAQEIQEVIY